MTPCGHAKAGEASVRGSGLKRRRMSRKAEVPVAVGLGAATAGAAAVWPLTRAGTAGDGTGVTDAAAFWPTTKADKGVLGGGTLADGAASGAAEGWRDGAKAGGGGATEEGPAGWTGAGTMSTAGGVV